jgi:hypothetical protein
MKRYIGALSAIALFAFAGPALAEDVSGKIQDLNEEARTITLEDGSSYQLGSGVSLEGLSIGQEVTLSVEEEDGQMVAQGVEPASPEAAPAPAGPPESCRYDRWAGARLREHRVDFRRRRVGHHHRAGLRVDGLDLLDAVVLLLAGGDHDLRTEPAELCRALRGQRHAALGGRVLLEHRDLHLELPPTHGKEDLRPHLSGHARTILAA